MAELFSPPELAFASVIDRGTSRRFKGIVVDVSRTTLTLALSSSPLLLGISEADVHQVGECSVVFVQLERDAVSRVRPDNWTNASISKLTPWPDSPSRIMTCYNELDAEVTAASSSERIATPLSQPAAPYVPLGVRPTPLLGRPSGSAPTAAMLAPTNDILTNAAQRFGVGVNSDSEAEEDEGDVPFEARGPLLANQHLPPGGLPMGMEPAVRPQRTSPQDEIAALINSGLIDAKDAAYLRVLQSLVKPAEPLPYAADDEEC